VPRYPIQSILRMCSHCKHLKFNIEHAEKNCPLKASQYCSYCASYGHLTRECYAKPAIWAREPCYVEQLIPPSELKERNITTKTPLPMAIPESENREYIEYVELKNLDAVIREFLRNRGLPVGKRAKENRDILAKYSNEKRVRVVFISAGVHRNEEE
jgi:hypothetical protein